MGGGFRLTASTPRQLEILATLPDHPSYSLRGDFSAAEITRALSGKSVTELVLHLNERLGDLRFLSGLPDLRELIVTGPYAHADLSQLAGLPLTDLFLRGEAASTNWPGSTNCRTSPSSPWEMEPSTVT